MRCQEKIEQRFARKPIALAIPLLFAGANALAQHATEQQLATVVVTASGYEQNIRDAAASITVITGSEIAKRSYTDLADVLKFVPGVAVQGSGTEQSISIRGMGNAYTLFLIDGRPAQGGDTFEFNGGGRGQQISFMPPLDMIERVEVIRGPASGLYGSDAMGGVINIITKKVSNTWKGGVTAEYLHPDGGNDVNGEAYNTSFILNGPLVDDVLGIQLSGGFRGTNEGSVVQFGDTSTGDADYKQRNIGAKVTWKADGRNTLTAGGSRTDTDRWRNPGRSLASTAAASYQGSAKDNLFVAHDGRYGKFSTSTYLNYDSASNPTTRTSAPSGVARGIDFDTLTLNSQGTWQPGAAHTLTGGFTYKNEQLEDGATSAVNVYNIANDAFVSMERYQLSAFAEDEWRLRENLALTASARYDYNEQYGGQWSPKAYLVYRASEALTVKGGAITGYKAPSLRNAAPDFSATSMGGVSIGNPDLKPETIVSVEFGVDYERSDLGLKASAVVYRTDFDDKITRSADFLCLPNVVCHYGGLEYPAHQYGYKQTINVDKARIHGAELALDYRFTGSLSVRANYTLTDSEQLTGASRGSPLNDQPKHAANLGLNYDHSRGTSLWAQAAYTGKFISTDLATGASTSQSYTLVDMGVVHRLKRNLALKFGIYNLANRQVANSSNGYVDGRRYSTALNYTF
ncbi:TonB-dependent receptor domain-containing protein [Pseudoduganella albidiflava]|uniref:Ligand-gated channel protein n=1 Tax=Pseudoduganella albidiflava TaxID=321983 RepID=A0A411WXN0_9BURK|nr:TonB-dependent receptor [Pseudoduganella albidiflava]QBI01454.1 TonB-dependent receptor [Pseudoduganella albidiflava]GGY35573.1 ligand-gated channel protein [Pseudoduganella albidiflava]